MGSRLKARSPITCIAIRDLISCTMGRPANYNYAAAKRFNGPNVESFGNCKGQFGEFLRAGIHVVES